MYLPGFPRYPDAFVKDGETGVMVPGRFQTYASQSYPVKSELGLNFPFITFGGTQAGKKRKSLALLVPGGSM